MSSQEKISVHSLADLKNTSDDAIPNYLNSLKFKQSHTLSDIRLALGYSAFLICAATFFWDYKLGFDATKYYTAIAVAIYTALNGALTFWIWGVEKGTVYAGTDPGGDKISISTSTKKHIPIYHITITTYSHLHPTVPSTITLSRPFTEWFDAAGHFIAPPFQQMFASNIQIIGALDQKNVIERWGMRKIKKPEQDGRSMDEKWASLLTESQDVLESQGPREVGSASTATPAKGGKRRGKKA